MSLNNFSTHQKFSSIFYASFSISLHCLSEKAIHQTLTVTLQLI